jgi:hypothetical protein
MAEKIKINLSNGQKKRTDEQFLKAPRNWQKCSALVLFVHFPSGETGEDHDAIFALSSALVDQDETLDLELNGNGTQESLVPKVLILNPDGNIKQDGKQDGNQAEVKEAPFQIKRPPICKFTRKGDNCRIQACKFTHLEQCKIKSHFPQRDFRCKNWHAKKPAASENYVGRTGPSSQTNKFKKTGSNQDSVRSLVEELRITKLELKVKQQADVIKKQKTTYDNIARPGRPGSQPAISTQIQTPPSLVLPMASEASPATNLKGMIAAMMQQLQLQQSQLVQLASLLPRSL